MTLILFSCEKEKKTVVDTTFKPGQDSLIWQYGYNTADMEVDGVIRNFVFHVPASYQHTKEAVPILLMLHGSGGDGDRFYNISGWVDKSDVEGFIAVFPTGYAYPIADNNGKLSNKWNDKSLSGEVVPGTPLQDDVAYMNWLISKFEKTFHINSSRRYVTGFSNGGGFVREKLVSASGSVFAAAATGGGFGVPEPLSIQGGRYLPLHCILGSMDDKIIEASGLGQEIPLDGPSFMALSNFRTFLDNMLTSLQIDTIYTEKSTPPAYNTLTFDRQLSNQKNQYILTIVNELEHNFPNGKNNKHNVSGPDLLWPWFQQWELK